MTDIQLEAWFAAAPESQRATLGELRRLIKSLDPGVVEEFKWSRPCYSGREGLFCYLQSARKHVSLGFQHGAFLNDPGSLLQGAGKEMRSVKLDPRTTPDHKALLRLLTQAYGNAS